MDLSKIQLSSAEAELMQNADIILTKNSVLQKMRGLLEEIQEKQLAFAKENDQDLFATPPKISKGEYYLGLPYLIFDYPRISASRDLVFIRTMFWWGRFFSCTLHVSGRYKTAFREKIKASYSLLPDYFIGVNPDPWVHHLEASNYKKINSMPEAAFGATCESLDHIKIAHSLALGEWREASVKLYENWKFLLSLCG
jgi:hypothetical protein